MLFLSSIIHRVIFLVVYLPSRENCFWLGSLARLSGGQLSLFLSNLFIHLRNLGAELLFSDITLHLES